MNASKASKILGITKMQVGRLLREEKLEGQKIGKRWVISHVAGDGFGRLTRR